MPGPIGYTVRFIRKQLDKHRQQPDGGANTPPEPLDDSGAGAAPAAPPPPPVAAGDVAAGKAAPLDEESAGKAGAPEATGVPRDPAHARSKRLSMIAIVVVGFGLAVDYTMSMMSIQPLYYTVAGPSSLYGFTFGSYDLTAMLCAPLFGLWCDMTRRFKPQIMLGAAVNAIGNLVYAFTVLVNGWWMMLIARLVSGVGAATLGVGSSYITQVTTSARRQVSLGRYRITQNVARTAGPFVGYLFIGLPNVDSDSSTALKLFNWYTVPGWAAFVVVGLLLAFFAWGFEDPTEENEHLVKPEAQAGSYGPPSPQRTARFRRFAGSWLLLSFFSVFAASAFTSNLFALFAGQYHQVTSQGENWKTYIGVGCGAMTAGFLFRRMIRWCPQYWEERKISLLSNWLLFVTWMLVIPYKGSTWVPPPALFYAATALAGFVVVINQASIETVFSKKVTQYADVVGDNIGKYMGGYFMAASAGRFAGPLVVAGVTRIATPWGATGYCTQWQGTECVGPWEDQCVITGDKYFVGGCVLYRAIPMYSAMAGLQFALCLAFHLVLARHWSWYNTEATPAGAAADGTAAPLAAKAGAGAASEGPEGKASMDGSMPGDAEAHAKEAS